MVNQEERSGPLSVALNHGINECKKDQSTFDRELAHCLGSLLQLQSVKFIHCLRACGAVALAETLKANTTPIELDLSRNGIGDVGAVAIAKAMKIQSFLK